MSKPLKTLQLFITNKCQFNCDFCFYRNQLNAKEMSFEDACSIVDKYINLYEIEKVNILGGEPTLHPDINSFVEYCSKEKNLFTSIYTNDTYFKGFQSDIYNNDKVDIRVSTTGFDGCKPISNINKNLSINLNILVDKNNQREVLSLLNFIIDNDLVVGFIPSSRKKTLDFSPGMNFAS